VATGTQLTERTNNLVFTRWQRLGQDRLYVALLDGRRLGYLDLVEGESHPDTPDLAAMLTLAYDAWWRAEHTVIGLASEPA